MKTIILFLLVCMLATGCGRNIQKNRSSADSTVVRSAETNDSWYREIITDYGPYDSSGPVVIPTSQSRLDLSLNAAHLYRPIVHYIPLPGQPYPVPIRQVVREGGRQIQAKKEEKTTSVQVATTQKEYSPAIERGLFLLTVFLVLTGIRLVLDGWVTFRKQG